MLLYLCLGPFTQVGKMTYKITICKKKKKKVIFSGKKKMIRGSNNRKIFQTHDTRTIGEEWLGSFFFFLITLWSYFILSKMPIDEILISYKSKLLISLYWFITLIALKKNSIYRLSLCIYSIITVGLHALLPFFFFFWQLQYIINFFLNLCLNIKIDRTMRSFIQRDQTMRSAKKEDLFFFSK